MLNGGLAGTNLSVNDGQIERESVENDGDVEAVGRVPMLSFAVAIAVCLRDDEEEGEDDKDEAENAPNQSQQVCHDNEKSRPDAPEESRFETGEHLASAREGWRRMSWWMQRRLY